MATCLGYGFAYRCWRAVGFGRLQRPRPLTGVTSLAGYGVNAAGVLSSRVVGTIGDAFAIETCVGSRTAAHRGTSVAGRVLAGSVPRGSILRLEGDIHVVSPEMTAVQLCGPGVPLVALVEELTELCGWYSLEPDGSATYCNHKPLTSKDAILTFLDAYGPRHGAKAARRALVWVLDGSASPRETALALIVTLPPRRGGYGFAAPRLNYRIDVTAAGHRYTDATCFFADECWPEARVIVEYDSDEHHLWGIDGEVDVAKVRRDQQRREALQAMGWTIITITTGHTRSYQQFCRKMAQLAKALGRRLPREDLETAMRREALQRWLFNPTHTRVNDDRVLDGLKESGRRVTGGVW